MFSFAVLLISVFCVINSEDNLEQIEDEKFSIKCIEIELCQSVQNVLTYGINNGGLHQTTIDLLKSYQCNSEDAPIKVWCRQERLETKMKSVIIEPPNVDGHKNVNLLPQDCGTVTISSKIRNGNTTGIVEYPWMALLAYKTNVGPVFRCGGTIINEQYILTAAHCITSKLLFVRIGDHNINTPIDCEINDNETYCSPTYRDLRIYKVISHSNHNKDSLFNNDIALIRVSKIDLSIENTRPICLPLHKIRKFDFGKKPYVTVTGWGATETGFASPDLRQALFTVTDSAICKQRYDKIASISHRQLCAAGNKSDSCGGDSGGPLQSTVRFQGDSRFYQHGIVSFGAKFCNNPHLPGVYTYIAFYMDWILDNIRP